MPRTLLLLVLLLACRIGRADPLDDLRRTLTQLSGGTAVLKGRIEYHHWREVTEDKRPLSSQAKATIRVEDGPDGLRLAFPAALFRTVAEEGRRQLDDPDFQAPLRTALRAIEPDEVAEMLDFAPALLRYLGSMQLTGEQQDSYQGQPARQLQVKMTPKLPSSIQKYLKTIEVDARIWLAPDGTPIGFRNNLVYRGSRLLVSFDGMQKDERALRRAGNRLVVVRHAHEQSFSTLGQRNQTRRQASLVLSD